eukprot:64236-Rhodomonas_salina.1
MEVWGGSSRGVMITWALATPVLVAAMRMCYACVVCAMWYVLCGCVYLLRICATPTLRVPSTAKKPRVPATRSRVVHRTRAVNIPRYTSGSR